MRILRRIPIGQFIGVAILAGVFLLQPPSGAAQPERLSQEPELLSIATTTEVEKQSNTVELDEEPVSKPSKTKEEAKPSQDTQPSEPPQTQPTQAPEPTPKPKVKKPFSITYSGVATDLKAIGESQKSLRAAGIEVMGHNGLVPKRCSSGSMGSSYAQGMAIKTPFTYPTCPDGGSPVYDEFRPEGYSCSLLYNVEAGNKLAILAHEVAHCKYFRKGQYRAFDIDYKKIREVSSLNRTQLNEVIADDMMICHYGLDTNWGSGSYYSLYDMKRPTKKQCAAINDLIKTYL